MRGFAREALETLADRSAAALAGDRLRELALIRLVELVGEAAARVPDEVQASHPQLPWREAIGLRNLLIHGYGQIRLEIVVATIRDNFPPLIATLDQVLGSEAS